MYMYKEEASTTYIISLSHLPLISCLNVWHSTGAAIVQITQYLPSSQLALHYVFDSLVQ